MENIQLSVRNVHVRYEDLRDPAVCGREWPDSNIALVGE